MCHITRVENVPRDWARNWSVAPPLPPAAFCWPFAGILAPGKTIQPAGDAFPIWDARQ